MRQLGTVADQCAGGKGHLTTRQNMQFISCRWPQVPDALHLLADVRLTTREACYNTVRNVTACPLAGVHAEEPFDVQPYARRLAFAFLHKELTDSLPRKFKVAFSGCPEDCIATAINDVGLRAVIRDGVHGFSMTVAGGLGPLPVEAKLLHEFFPAEEVVRRVEAVIRVFNVHGNRKDKNKARLKFVMRARGFDWLRDTIEEQYQDILANGGIPMPESVPENFGGFQPVPPPPGTGEMLPDVRRLAGVQRLARDQRPAAEAARLRHRHGDDAAGQPDRRSDARSGVARRTSLGRRDARHHGAESGVRVRSGGRAATRVRRADSPGACQGPRRRDQRRRHLPGRL